VPCPAFSRNGDNAGFAAIWQFQPFTGNSFAFVIFFDVAAAKLVVVFSG
jgi:hypothetical protein